MFLCCRLQLAERYAGNRAYKQQNYTTAMHHYERALAVVNFVVGSTPDDQAEVQHNKATVLLNMAAVHMALQVSRYRWGLETSLAQHRQSGTAASCRILVGL